jgi:hypothetical protein
MYYFINKTPNYKKEEIVKYFECYTHVEQELPTFPESMSSPPVLSGVHVARSLVFCIVF